jgi:ATP-dependent exoDNAse (exonuclease V) alpha subunit
MQVEDDYDKEVYNGDLGVVRSIDPEPSEMVIEFDGREVTYGFGELDEVVLAYATTIHKSQGSEYPAVVILHHANTIRCCSGTCSTPRSRAASGWSSSRGRKKRWRPR